MAIMKGSVVMDTKKSDKKKRLVKIIVPIVIVGVLIILWNVKTQSTSPSTDEQTESVAGFELEITSIDLDELTAYNLPILIDFGADSCGPCQEMAPALETINAEMQGKAVVKFIDVWENEDAIGDFPIQLIPTQLFINADGTPYVPSEDINIEFSLYNNDAGEHAFTVHQGILTEDQMRTILGDMGVAE